MARGWESKSVESQQADAAVWDRRQTQETPDAAHLELVRAKENLVLSRTRILHELEASRNPRYREILGHALQDLDSKLAAVDEVRAARAASA